MAPTTKGVKRAAEEQAPLAKRTKDVLKQNEVAQYKLQAIIGSLAETAHLGDNCRDMLVATLPFSLVVPSDERLEPQKNVVAMVEEVFTKLSADFTSDIDAEQTSCKEFVDSRGGLADKVVATEALALAASSAADDKKAAFADKQAELSAKKGVLATRVEEERSSNASLEEARTDKDVYEAALSKDLKALRDDELNSQQATMHLKVVVPLLTRVKADASLLAALPGTCEKKPEARGPFDNMVIQQLEQVLTQKVEELRTTLANAAPEASARAAAVAAAQGEVDEATAATTQASDELNHAQASLKDAQDAAQAARDAVANFEPALQKAVEQLRSKEADFKHFQEHGLAHFTQLRDRISKKLQREQAAAKAAEEAAVQEAEEATVKQAEEAAAAAKQAEVAAAFEEALAAAKLAEEAAAAAKQAEEAAAAAAAAGVQENAPEQPEQKQVTAMEVDTLSAKVVDTAEETIGALVSAGAGA